MDRSQIRIGLTAELFDTSGKPFFGQAPLQLLADAGFAWDVLPPSGGMITPAAIATHDAMLIGGARVTEESLAQDNGRLRVIARNGVGFDAVDIAAMSKRGILVTNTPVAVRHPVATAALTFILALALRLPLKSKLPREGRWQQRTDFPGHGLRGRTLGIVGFGGIGRELARLIQPFDMKILAADPHQRDCTAGVELVGLETLLAQADFVVISCLLDGSTRHLINAPRLALMKPSAFLINIARGPIIEETALVRALQAGAIAGAALDVFEKEPRIPAIRYLRWKTLSRRRTRYAGPITSSTKSPAAPSTASWMRSTGNSPNTSSTGTPLRTRA